MSRGVRDFSDDFMVEDAAYSRRRAPGGLPPGAPPPTAEREEDPHRLAQRQKQVDLGKNTLGYQRYRAAVPWDKRNRKEHPITPDIYQVCSKRAFDGQIKKWRRMLHEWDLPEDAEQQGELGLLPVVTDRGGPAASNPPPPQEVDEDYEHISHADAAGGAAKNGGGLLRPVGNLPLKIPSAMRKRAYDETTADSEAQQQPKENGAAHSGQAAPGAKAARRSVDGAEASPGASAKAAAAAVKAKAAHTPAAAVQAKEPNWAEQRYTDPDLDYGEGFYSEGEDEWQRVERPAAPQLAGQYRSITHINPLSWEDEIQI